MKIVQSFWTGNISNITQNSFGWLSSKYNLISWILSVNQLVKYYSNVELYTDELGAEILISKLKLPYTNVHIVLNELDNYHNELWALSKIKTYSLQNEPFLHVDGDVFIFKAFPERLLKSNLITQNLEIATDYYKVMWEGITDELLFLPNELSDYNKTKVGYACNMGIVGGNDFKFFKLYANKAFEFVDKNKSAWSKISKNNFNVFFEQLLFYELTKKHKKKVNFLFDEILDDNKYVGFGDFDKTPKHRTYLHLLGDYKKHIPTFRTMENYVLKFYPEFYKRLIRLIDEELFFNKLNYNFTTKENKILIKNFNSTIQTSKKLDNNYFLSRDISFIGLVQNFRELLGNNEKIILYKLPCNEFYVFDNFKDIIVHEKLGAQYNLSIDKIDELLLEQLKKPMNYDILILKLKQYLNNEILGGSIDVFIKMINERLMFFISRRVIHFIKG